MRYIEIKFTKGLDCEAFQEIENGNVIAIKDANGAIIDISEIQTESVVIDDNPQQLEWFINA
jgi:hypothetical protein